MCKFNPQRSVITDLFTGVSKLRNSFSDIDTKVDWLTVQNLLSVPKTCTTVTVSKRENSVRLYSFLLSTIVAWQTKFGGHCPSHILARIAIGKRVYCGEVETLATGLADGCHRSCGPRSDLCNVSIWSSCEVLPANSCRGRSDCEFQQHSYSCFYLLIPHLALTLSTLSQGNAAVHRRNAFQYRE